MEHQLINNYLEKWVEKSPNKTAVIQSEDGRKLSYKELHNLADFFALRLLDSGIKKGDIVVTQLGLFPEHVALMYACLKIGAIFTPIDLRLKKEEVERSLKKVNPKIFFLHGKTDVIDFNEIADYIVSKNLVDLVVQVVKDPSSEKAVKGAITIQEFMSKPKLVWLKIKNTFTQKLAKAYSEITPQTPAIIIFTTGTTGAPKPALMNHENVIVQNEILTRGMHGKEDTVMLVNLPPSHVGCLTEALLTSFYAGGTAVILRIFNVQESLRAIEKYKVTILGQIPTQFRMMWAEPNYDQFDLSSLEFAIYGGSSVDVEFLKKLKTMAPKFGTGLGMTETAGFTTFTPDGISVEEMAGQVGTYYEDLGIVSIRKPMNDDGTAGEEVPDGEKGDICYHPPIVFMGYYNHPEETKNAISKEGILYSGDYGYFKNMGSYRALYLEGRNKFTIKQKGYKVFPDEVQSFIAEHPKVDQVDVVGAKHQLFDEGIFAFVKAKADVELSPEEIMEHCKKIAAYKRPQHVEIWPSDELFPLTRTSKVDKMALKRLAAEKVEILRADHKWDAAK